jgi:hypothetical protein
MRFEPGFPSHTCTEFHRLARCIHEALITQMTALPVPTETLANVVQHDTLLDAWCLSLCGYTINMSDLFLKCHYHHHSGSVHIYVQYSVTLRNFVPLLLPLSLNF